jgi:nicotinamidase-related amidase
MEDQAEIIKHSSSRRIFLKAAGLAGVGLPLLDSESMLWAAKPSKQETTGARSMNPKTTAIVLIEYQNDFTTSGGVFHDGVKGVMQSSNMLANTVDLVNKSREAGVTIMHAPITFAEGYGELTGNPYGILKAVVDNKAFRKGSWGAAIVDVLKPHPEDILIEGKRGLDTFPSTNLDFILRSKGIHTVVLGGFLTNCCVESTMRSAYERGFDVVTLKDCTAALSEEEQNMALAHNFGMFSRPMNHDEFLKQLS